MQTPSPVADVPVNGHSRPVDAQLFGRIDRSPDLVSVVLADCFAILLEIRVYRQGSFTCLRLVSIEILDLFPYSTANLGSKALLRKSVRISQLPDECWTG